MIASGDGLAWLAELPVVDPQTVESLSVRGLLVSSAPERVRVVVDDQALDFARDDVVDVQVLPPLDRLRTQEAVHVRLWLRPGAKLLGTGAGPVEPDALFVTEQPFAVAARPLHLTLETGPTYQRLEREYLVRHGLESSS